MVRKAASARSLLLTALAALGCAAAAVGADAPAGTTTYRWVDAQGVVHYSDTPQPGAQQLRIPPAQTYQSSAASGRTNGADQPAATDARVNCRVVQPVADQSLFAPQSVAVSVAIEPPAASDDQIAVALDGEPLKALDDSGLHYRVESPERGTHTLTVTVRDPAGNVICRAPALTFSVQRPSLLSPLAPGRGH